MSIWLVTFAGHFVQCSECNASGLQREIFNLQAKVTDSHCRPPCSCLSHLHVHTPSFSPMSPTGCWALLQNDRHSSFYCASQVLSFEQSEGKTLHHQKGYDSLYCTTCFIVVVWKQPCNPRGLPVVFALNSARLRWNQESPPIHLLRYSTDGEQSPTQCK